MKRYNRINNNENGINNDKNNKKKKSKVWVSGGQIKFFFNLQSGGWNQGPLDTAAT
jgi:hypothetical protein